MRSESGEARRSGEGGLGWLSRQLALLIGFLVAAAMFLISAVMNFRFGLSLGRGEIDPWLYAAASVAADGFKALLPILIFLLAARRRWLLAGAGAALWALCVAWSLASAMGFAASSRDAASAEREAALETRRALSEQAERLETQLKALPDHRPAGAVAAAIANAEVPRDVWRRTRECADVTRPDSLAACQEVLALRRELAVAEDAARLEAALGQTRSTLAAAPALGGQVDPQAETLGAALGFAPEKARQGLALLLALLIEAGSSLGFTLVFLGVGAAERKRWAAGLFDRRARRERRRDDELHALEVEDALHAARIESRRRRERLEADPAPPEETPAASAAIAPSPSPEPEAPAPPLPPQEKRLELPDYTEDPRRRPPAAAIALTPEDLNQDYGFDPAEENQDAEREAHAGDKKDA